MRAATETIAELGYAQSSFVRIAERAGLSSTRLISYHFDGRTDLVRQIISEIYTAIGAFMGERMATPATAAEALRTYIRANIEFIATHRTEMKALLYIFLSGALGYDADSDAAVVSPLEDVLRRGQDSGEFRSFDSRVLATAIQRAIDGLPFLLESRPDLDPDVYAAELVDAFTLATAANERRGAG